MAYQQLSRTLFTNDLAMVALLQIWDKYKHHLLIDLPDERSLPISVDDFEKIQVRAESPCEPPCSDKQHHHSLTIPDTRGAPVAHK